MQISYKKYYKTKKFASLCYFDTCFIYNTGGVSDRRLYDSLSMQYIDKESCLRLSETRPTLCIKYMSK